jgi:hypothetical protein
VTKRQVSILVACRLSLIAVNYFDSCRSYDLAVQRIAGADLFQLSASVS